MYVIYLINSLGIEQSPLISVIIPVYNVEAYIDESIESVINQTYTNLEIIIIDDGSTDKSGNICDCYAKNDTRITVIHQDNQGLSAARNTGLDVLHGDIIAFIDPDDSFCPNMLESLLNAMIEECADIAICDFTWHKTRKRMKQNFFSGFASPQNVILCHREEALRRVLHGNIDAAVWNKIYRREIWDNLRFPVGHVYEGTYIVFDIFSRAENIVIIGDKLVMHRKRDGSICNTSSTKNQQDVMIARKHFLQFVRDNTPGLFLPDELYYLESKQIKPLIVQYIYSIIEGDKTAIRARRKALKEIGKRDILKHCSIAIQIGYWVTLRNPEVAHQLYLPYRLGRRLQKKMLDIFKTIQNSY